MKKMDRKFVLNEIQKNVEALSAPSAYIPIHQKATPSVKALEEMMSLLRKTMYPGFFGAESEVPHEFVPYHLGIYLEQIYDILETQIFNGLRFETECQDEAKEQAARAALSQFEKPIVVPEGISHPQLYKRLAEWRREKSKETGERIVRILRTATIVAIVKELPTTEKELQEMPGFGKKKQEQYGKEILKIIIAYLGKG